MKSILNIFIKNIIKFKFKYISIDFQSLYTQLQDQNFILRQFSKHREEQDKNIKPYIIISYV